MSGAVGDFSSGEVLIFSNVNALDACLVSCYIAYYIQIAQERNVGDDSSHYYLPTTIQKWASHLRGILKEI